MNKSRFAIIGGSLLATSFFLPAAYGQTIDVSKGRQRAEVCMACHGQDGLTPVAPAIPLLAGQDRDYLVKALTAYKSWHDADRPDNDRDGQAVEQLGYPQHRSVFQQPAATEALTAGSQMERNAGARSGDADGCYPPV